MRLAGVPEEWSARRVACLKRRVLEASWRHAPRHPLARWCGALLAELLQDLDEFAMDKVIAADDMAGLQRIVIALNA
jgi:hypothetical protein